MTKLQLAQYIAWCESEARNLFDVYKRPAPKRQEALAQAFIEFCENPLAKDFRVIRPSKRDFSVAWLVESSDEFRLHVCSVNGEHEFTIIRR